MSSQSVAFLQTILPVFFVLALGYYAGKRKRVENTHPEALIALLMQFALPCSLFLGVGSAPPAVLRSQAPLLLMLVCMMLMTYGLAFFVARKWLKSSISEAAVQALTIGFANNVAIGFPLLTKAYGAPGLLAVTCGILSGALVLSPLTLVLLECEAQRKLAGEHLSMRQSVGKALAISLRRPVILAPALGLLLPLTGHTIPVMFVSSLDLIGKATIGVALFLTGLILSAQPFRLTKGVVSGVLLKMVVQPCLLFGLLWVFHIHGLVAKEALLLSCVPAGFFGTVFGARYRVGSVEAGSVLALSTLLSAGTLPVALMLAARLP